MIKIHMFVFYTKYIYCRKICNSHIFALKVQINYEIWELYIAWTFMIELHQYTDSVDIIWTFQTQLLFSRNFITSRRSEWDVYCTHVLRQDTLQRDVKSSSLLMLNQIMNPLDIWCNVS